MDSPLKSRYSLSLIPCNPGYSTTHCVFVGVTIKALSVPAERMNMNWKLF